MASSDYVRVKRKNTTIFLYICGTDSAHEVRAKVSTVTKVPVHDIKLYLDANGEVGLDENKTLAEQKVRRLRRLARRARCTHARPSRRARRARACAKCGGAHGCGPRAGRERPGALHGVPERGCARSSPRHPPAAACHRPAPPHKLAPRRRERRVGADRPCGGGRRWSRELTELQAAAVRRTRRRAPHGRRRHGTVARRGDGFTARVHEPQRPAARLTHRQASAALSVSAVQ